MVKIRMSRAGRVKVPVYHIVAADARYARDGRFLEKLGVYTPKAKIVLTNVKYDAIQKWVDKGAQVSDTVRTVLKKYGTKTA